MTVKKINPYWFAVLFLAGLGVFPLQNPEAFHIDEVVSSRYTQFPMSFGDWKGKDEAVDPKTFQILETKNLLSRVYENSNGDRVSLLLVGSRTDRRVAHPPEVCFLGSHYMVLDKKESELTLDSRKLKVREFKAKSKNQNYFDQHVMYLYQVGERYTTNYYEQQLQFAWDRLTRKNSEILLIRLAGSRPDAFQNFLQQVISELQNSKA